MKLEARIEHLFDSDGDTRTYCTFMRSHKFRGTLFLPWGFLCPGLSKCAFSGTERKRTGKDRRGDQGHGHDFTQTEQRQLEASLWRDHRLSGKMSFPHGKVFSAYNRVSQL